MANADPPNSYDSRLSIIALQTLPAYEEGTYCKASRSISSSGPSPTTIKPKAFIFDNREQTSTAEGFRVGLPFNFEDVKRQKDNLSNSDQTVTAMLKVFLETVNIQDRKLTFRLWHA